MSILIFLIISYILFSLSLYKLFEKAGEDGWKALVPGLNFVVMAKLIGRKMWWPILLLIPIVNIFIFAGMCVDMVRSFGKYDFKDSALAVIFSPIAFFLIGANKEDKYLGPTLDAENKYAQQLLEAEKGGNVREYKKLVANNPYKKSASREWVEAVVFAVFAAAFIRMFLIEAYVIPTPSMEGSLNVGDFLFVSKAHYGIRTPMTVAMFPLIHNTVPFIGSESYLKTPKLDYHRLKPIEEIDPFEPVVFNYPEGDSVFVTPGRNYSVHDLRRDPGLRQVIGSAKMRVRPIDKKDHYIKRCVAVPGQTLEIKDRQLYIDGKEAPNPTHLQFRYKVIPEGNGSITKKLEDLNVNLTEIEMQKGGPGYYHLNNEQAAALKELKGCTVEVVDFGAQRRRTVFPHDVKNYGDWTVDNYGPITLPKAGETVTITPNNVALYTRVITAYEGNELSIKNGRIFINGEQSTSYTFKQDYYWMMGDNRHNSEDSRVWGFVPHDHIVGKPLFIWFSTKNGSIFNGINWDRIFTSANKFD